MFRVMTSHCDGTSESTLDGEHAKSVGVLVSSFEMKTLSNRHAGVTRLVNCYFILGEESKQRHNANKFSSLNDME